jgi:PEGA domain
MCLTTAGRNPSIPETARSRKVFSARFGLLLLAICCFAQVGCVSRRVTVQSNPPGALVLIDGQEQGYTPYSMDFTYYGTREIQLVKPGFETLTVMQKVPKPWYQIFPIEFVSDNLWPFRVTNRSNFYYQMQPNGIASEEGLLDRATGLRNESQVGR